VAVVVSVVVAVAVVVSVVVAVAVAVRQYYHCGISSKHQWARALCPYWDICKHSRNAPSPKAHPNLTQAVMPSTFCSHVYATLKQQKANSPLSPFLPLSKH